MASHSSFLVLLVCQLPDNSPGFFACLGSLENETASRDPSVQLLVDQLRQKCLEEPRSDDRPRGFSALTQDPKECVQEVRWPGCLLHASESLLFSLQREPFQPGQCATDGGAV